MDLAHQNPLSMGFSRHKPKVVLVEEALERKDATESGGSGSLRADRKW